jgi:integrase
MEATRLVSMDRRFRNGGEPPQRRFAKILTSMNDETYVERSRQNTAEYLGRRLTAAKRNLAPKTFERYKQLVDVNIKPETWRHPVERALDRSGQTHYPFLAIPIGFCTDMRRGEVLALRWADVDLKKGKLTIHQLLTKRVRAVSCSRAQRRIVAANDQVASRLQTLLRVIARITRQQGFVRTRLSKDGSCRSACLWPPDRFTDTYIAFARKNGAKDLHFHDNGHLRSPDE